MSLFGKEEYLVKKRCQLVLRARHATVFEYIKAGPRVSDMDVSRQTEHRKWTVHHAEWDEEDKNEPHFHVKEADRSYDDTEVCKIVAKDKETFQVSGPSGSPVIEVKVKTVETGGVTHVGLRGEDGGKTFSGEYSSSDTRHAFVYDLNQNQGKILRHARSNLDWFIHDHDRELGLLEGSDALLVSAEYIPGPIPSCSVIGDGDDHAHLSIYL
ncbi:MAG: hypothetical protein Q9162_004043 [Coniocarpon cinnabarinum]